VRGDNWSEVRLWDRWSSSQQKSSRLPGSSDRSGMRRRNSFHCRRQKRCGQALQVSYDCVRGARGSSIHCVRGAVDSTCGPLVQDALQAGERVVRVVGGDVVGASQLRTAAPAQCYGQCS
jgi:hypothetical protein